jgi:heptosyltransferase III
MTLPTPHKQLAKYFDIDVTTTAGLRPEIFEITCRSFHNRLLKQFKSTRLILNIDKIGETNVAPEEMVEIASRYFTSVHWNAPETPGFGFAAQWCWQQVESEIFIHMEDDWLLSNTVNADHALSLFREEQDLASLRLYLRRYPSDPLTTQKLSLNPGFFRKTFIKAALQNFNPNLDPEKQFYTDPMLNALAGWEHKLYGRPKDPAYVVDIGKKWRRHTGLEKWEGASGKTSGIIWNDSNKNSYIVNLLHTLKYKTTLHWWSWCAGHKKQATTHKQADQDSKQRPIPCKDKNIAVICANSIGDALTWMVIAYNLHLSKAKVTVYSNVLFGMANWFPWCHIKNNTESSSAILNNFDYIIADYHSFVAREQIHAQEEKLIIPRESCFDRSDQRIENMKEILHKTFGIAAESSANGILLPSQINKNTNRIVIHPTASNKNREWGRNNFINLAHMLMSRGYRVSFIMSKEESESTIWDMVAQYGIDLHGFTNLSECATHILESAYFIGSDSGLGHLSSNLGVPTVSIFVRKSHSTNWRPGWSIGEVVSPLNPLPGRFLRQHYWRPFLSPAMVLRSFDKLTSRAGTPLCQTS